MNWKPAIALLCAATVGLLAHALITSPPQKPKGGIGAPYLVPDPPCATHQDSCALCFVEELARLMRTGKIPRDERRLREKLAWARKFKAEHCGWDPDTCNGKRSICSSRTNGRIEFTVHAGVMVDGECLACQGKGKPLFEKLIAADFTSWENRHHFPVFLPQQSTINDADENVLNLHNGLYQEWEQRLPDEVPPSVPYRIIVPCAPASRDVRASDARTWRLDPKGNETDGITELTAFDARWFDLYDKKDPYAVRFLYDLSCAFACYEGTALKGIPIKRSNTMVKAAYGSYLGHPFLFGTGFVEKQGLPTFFPVKAGSISGPVMKAVTRDGDITDKRILDLFQRWAATGNTAQVVCAALPKTRKAGSPWNEIGRPQGSQQVSDTMAQRIGAGKAEELDYLIQEGATYWAQRSTSAILEVKWLKERLNTRHTQLLAIAHPQLNILADRKEDGRTAMVFTWPGADAIYSWSWSGTEAPKERILLSASSDTLALTGESTMEYIRSLVARTPAEGNRLTDREAEFFLDQATQSESSAKVIWLDWFQAEQVLLFAKNSPFKDKDGSIAIQFERLGPGSMGAESDQQLIKLTDADGDLRLSAFSQRYLPSRPKTWKREKFAEVILPISVPQEFWLSTRPDRVGSTQTAGGSVVVKVFTTSRVRDTFGPAHWSIIRETIRKDRVIYHSPDLELGSTPSGPFDLLKVCLSTEDQKLWSESERWRANPLAYLDRCKSPNR